AHRHVSGAVEILKALSPEAAADALADLPHERAVDAHDNQGLVAAANNIQRLPSDRESEVLGKLSADRSVPSLLGLDEVARMRLLEHLDPEPRASLHQLLSYPRDTAGGLMTTEFVSVPPSWTVEATLQHIREVERTRETVYAIHIVEPETR